jgi:hypothetical protein
MLKFGVGKATDRQLNLFACACCRHIWHLLTDSRSRDAIEVMERFADGFASEAERQQAGDDSLIAQQELEDTVGISKLTYAADAAAMAFEEGVDLRAERAMLNAFDAVAETTQEGEATYYLEDGVMGQAEVAYQCDLLRDIFGDPFPTISLSTAWLTPTVHNLAAAAYEERALPSGELDPARLAVLADALEEAGCDNADMLTHLRSPGPHVRGCWVVDLLLAKE